MSYRIHKLTEALRPGPGTANQLVVVLASTMLCVVAPFCSKVSAQFPNIARDLVNPFIGTGGHGHTFPGPCVPFGSVQLSPDTRPDGIHDWDGASGYHYGDSVIYGFSHTHLSGTGVSDLCDVLLMPMSGSFSTDPDEYRSSFRKETEEASAGYYRVHLDEPDVTVELTATQRVGVHRYTYPRGSTAHVILDLEHRDFVRTTSIVRVNDREVVGERRSSSWASDQRLFFCIRFDHPMLENDGQRSLAGAIAAFGKEKDHFSFGDLAGETLVVKVGISAVSIEGARANLDVEVPHWDFDRVRREAESTWNATLGRVHVKGGGREEQRIFYTALYHSMIAPCIFNDVDGNYRGMDGEIHHADHDVYTIFSLWDTFRSLHPLMTILEPERTRDWIRTMLLHYTQGGRLPVWELWGNETDCMIGYHSVSVIADAYLKGIRGFDAHLALQAMVASAEADHYGLDAYKERGYISSEDGPESVSRTLEYAYDDWCIAQMAEALGRQDIADRFTLRSRQWQNLYDPGTKFFRPRRNGGFIEPFDPHEVNFHYTEANAWHYAFFVPHDMTTFIGLLGGRAELTRQLDALFTAEERTTGRDQSDISGMIGQYAHGNEPSHGFAYLYNLSDRPFTTDLYVSRIMRELYKDAPDGLSGNEDCGQMSAWYVLSALGFHPITPGSAHYSLGIPLFEEVSIMLGPERTLRITGAAEAGSRDHVVSIEWNDEDTKAFRTLAHAELAEGGHLHFELGPRPGSKPVDVMEEEDPFILPRWVPVPIIHAPSAVLTESMEVDISCSDPHAELLHRINGGDWQAHEGPLVIDMDTHLEAVAVRQVPNDGGEGIRSLPVSARFKLIDGSRTMTLESEPAPQYSAGGEQALVDGERGGSDFRTGEWQGFEGQDLLATVDLGRPQRITRLGLGVLQNERSWIWYPSEVEFAVSTNGRQWSTVHATHTVPRDLEGSHSMELWTDEFVKRARYVKIIARSAGPCPEWHPGSGRPSWIFADEFLIDVE